MSINGLTFRWQALRIPLLLLLLLGLYLGARQSAVLEEASPQAIRDLVLSWGNWGVLLYVALFSLGLLLYIPGTLMIVGAGLAYGTSRGLPVALLGANVAMAVSFLTVRTIGGSPFETHRHPWIEKLLANLHSRPIFNIAVMRLFFSTAPGLNYLLALSAVTFGQHALGSFIGTLLPVALTVYLADWLIVNLF